MIEGFKHSVEKELQPIASYWIDAPYFKEVYQYVNNSKLNLEQRLSNVGYYLRKAFKEYMLIKSSEAIDHIIVYLAFKTLQEAYKTLHRRLELKNKVNNEPPTTPL